MKNFKVNVVRNSWLLNHSADTFIDSSIWEKEKSKGPTVIKNLIETGLKKTTVATVLIGDETAERRWVKYEIVKSFEKGNGILGFTLTELEVKNKQFQLVAKTHLRDLHFKYQRTVKKLDFTNL